MPFDQQSKQYHSAISDDLRYQICEWLDTNKNKKYHKIAAYFNEKYLDMNIDRSTISKILKEKDKWKTVVSAKVSNKTFK